MRALAESGVDISSARPKPVEPFLDEPFDLVITVCGGANENRPAFRGSVGRRLHISFDDPAAAAGSEEEALAVFRRVRDEIRHQMRGFVEAAIRHTLRPATARNLEGVRALLTRCGLPLDGLEKQFPAGYALATREGTTNTRAGLERCGDYGLLRSVRSRPSCAAWVSEPASPRIVWNGRARSDCARSICSPPRHPGTPTGLGFAQSSRPSAGADSRRVRVCRHLPRERHGDEA